ncbi:MAG TPA: 50S ribosomal protein L6 [Verrucomicrobiae bacterium]|nr:50S ribosomal protein L6 [Verrucomicrobiae bacterium]
MSRIGRLPIPVPDGVTVRIEPPRIEVVGPRGTLQRLLPSVIKVAAVDGQLVVERPTDAGPHRALHGLTRTLVANMVEGVTRGFRRELELVGVGYRASLQGADLQLALGFAHPVRVATPSGITIEVPDPTHIAVVGTDKEQVGQTAAKIRSLRPPEPYKGKGILYRGERVRRKAGKSGKAGKK